MQVSETVRRAELLERATLVLNQSWQPVHVTTVRRALCTVYRDAARVICPETLATYERALGAKRASGTKASLVLGTDADFFRYLKRAGKPPRPTASAQ